MGPLPSLTLRLQKLHFCSHSLAQELMQLARAPPLQALVGAVAAPPTGAPAWGPLLELLPGGSSGAKAPPTGSMGPGLPPNALPSVLLDFSYLSSPSASEARIAGDPALARADAALFRALAPSAAQLLAWARKLLRVMGQVRGALEALQVSDVLSAQAALASGLRAPHHTAGLQALCECVSFLGFLLLLLDHLLPGRTRECLLILAYRRHTQLPPGTPDSPVASGDGSARKGSGRHPANEGTGAGAGAGAGTGAGGGGGGGGGAAQGSGPPWSDFESLCLVSRRTAAGTPGILSWLPPLYMPSPFGKGGARETATIRHLLGSFPPILAAPCAQELFGRFPLREDIIAALVQVLTGADLYGTGALLPGSTVDPLLSFRALSAQAGQGAILLLWAPQVLRTDQGQMSAFVERLLCGSPGARQGAHPASSCAWVAPLFLGFALDLSATWAPFPAAKSALGARASPAAAESFSLSVAERVGPVLGRVQEHTWMLEEAREAAGLKHPEGAPWGATSSTREGSAAAASLPGAGGGDWPSNRALLQGEHGHTWRGSGAGDGGEAVAGLVSGDETFLGRRRGGAQGEEREGADERVNGSEVRTQKGEGGEGHGERDSRGESASGGEGAPLPSTPSPLPPLPAHTSGAPRWGSVDASWPPSVDLSCQEVRGAVARAEEVLRAVQEANALLQWLFLHLLSQHTGNPLALHVTRAAHSLRLLATPAAASAPAGGALFLASFIASQSPWDLDPSAFSPSPSVPDSQASSASRTRNGSAGPGPGPGQGAGRLLQLLLRTARLEQAAGELWGCLVAHRGHMLGSLQRETRAHLRELHGELTRGAQQPTRGPQYRGIRAEGHSQSGSESRPDFGAWSRGGAADRHGATRGTRAGARADASSSASTSDSDNTLSSTRSRTASLQGSAQGNELNSGAPPALPDVMGGSGGLASWVLALCARVDSLGQAGHLADSLDSLGPASGRGPEAAVLKEQGEGAPWRNQGGDWEGRAEGSEGGGVAGTGGGTEAEAGAEEREILGALEEAEGFHHWSSHPPAKQHLLDAAAAMRALGHCRECLTPALLPTLSGLSRSPYLWGVLPGLVLPELQALVHRRPATLSQAGSLWRKLAGSMSGPLFCAPHVGAFAQLCARPPPSPSPAPSRAVGAPGTEPGAPRGAEASHSSVPWSSPGPRGEPLRAGPRHWEAPEPLSHGRLPSFRPLAWYTAQLALSLQADVALPAARLVCAILSDTLAQGLTPGAPGGSWGASADGESDALRGDADPGAGSSAGPGLVQEHGMGVGQGPRKGAEGRGLKEGSQRQERELALLQRETLVAETVGGILELHGMELQQWNSSGGLSPLTATYVNSQNPSLHPNASVHTIPAPILLPPATPAGPPSPPLPSPSLGELYVSCVRSLVRAHVEDILSAMGSLGGAPGAHPGLAFEGGSGGEEGGRARAAGEGRGGEADGKGSGALEVCLGRVCRDLGRLKGCLAHFSPPLRLKGPAMLQDAVEDWVSCRAGARLVTEQSGGSVVTTQGAGLVVKQGVPLLSPTLTPLPQDGSMPWGAAEGQELQCLLSALLRFSSPLATLYLPPLLAWYGATGRETLGVRLVRGVQEALGCAGLRSLLSLLAARREAAGGVAGERLWRAVGGGRDGLRSVQRGLSEGVLGLVARGDAEGQRARQGVEAHASSLFGAVLEPAAKFGWGVSGKGKAQKRPSELVAALAHLGHTHLVHHMCAYVLSAAGTGSLHNTSTGGHPYDGSTTRPSCPALDRNPTHSAPPSISEGFPPRHESTGSNRSRVGSFAGAAMSSAGIRSVATRSVADSSLASVAAFLVVVSQAEQYRYDPLLCALTPRSKAALDANALALGLVLVLQALEAETGTGTQTETESGGENGCFGVLESTIGLCSAWLNACAAGSGGAVEKVVILEAWLALLLKWRMLVL